ncbi:acyltransferase [bacterium]|nr:acyltransferase [bacterium]
MKHDLPRTFLDRFLSLFGEGFGCPALDLRIRFKHLIIQKLLRVNSHVPWPVHWTSQIKGVDKIRRGNRFPGLGLGTYLDGRNGIVLGRNTWLGPRVSLISMNHRIDDFHSFEECPPIVIGDNCWLGASVVILPGVHLGNHVICAAGAVVTKSFPQDNILLAGVPARMVKSIPPYHNNGQDSPASQQV